MMNSILFLLGNYTPKPSANGVCVTNLSEYLISKGYSVFCICNKTGDKYFFEENGVKVYSIDIPFAKRLEIKLSNFSKNKKGILSLISHINLLTSVISYPISRVHVKRIIKESQRIILENNINVIVGVNMPVDMIYAASKLKSNNKNLFFVSYFLDPLSLACKHALLGPNVSLKRGIKYEKYILEQSDLILSQFEHENHLSNNYDEIILDKVKFIGVPLLNNYISDTDGMMKNRINGVYAGAFWKGIRSPEYIIALFKKLPFIDIFLYVSNGFSWVRSLINDAPNIHLCNPLSHEEMIKRMKNADFLINVGNNLENQSPSKLYEYFGFGKPIVSTSCIDNDPSIEILEKYGYYISLREDLDNIDNDCELVQQFIKKNKRKIKYKDLEKIFFYSTPNAFFEIVDSLQSQKKR